ncbi:ommochrome-binding protein-like [Choristoneura fumiferana]|uniref:ommochrome-binding protein-like n=1 Tax=Choristoneura fumiferana TaxID=7141 RepID=UPI003D15C7FC
MNLLQALFCIIAIQTTTCDFRKHCEGPIINNIHYSKIVLKNGIYYPRSLAYDHSTTSLFFSYCPDIENYTVRSAKINLNTNVFEDIEGVRNGFVQTVDVNSNDVFIGGSDGVYKYDKLTKIAELYGANGTVIWKLFSKDVVYFSEYPSQFLYKIVDGVVYRLRDLEETKAKNFVIDDYDYLYFTNNSGLFRQKKDTKDAVYYEGTKDMYISGLSISNLGDVHASTDNGHVVGMDEARVPKRLLEGRRAAEVEAGLSSDGWTAEQDTKNLGVISWRRKTMNRSHWRDLQDQAKAHPQL